MKEEKPKSQDLVKILAFLEQMFKNKLKKKSKSKSK